MIHIQIDNEQYEHEAAKRLSTKANLRLLVTFRKQEDHLINLIKQLKAKKMVYTEDSTSNRYILSMINKQNFKEQLKRNISIYHEIDTALNVCRKDIEQIYHGKFNREYKSIRENDLRFDSIIIDVKHNFLNDLYTFTNLRFGDIE